MATVLQIKTSISGSDSQSNQLAEVYLKQWKESNPNGKVVVRDLIANPVPHLDMERVVALRAPSDPITAEQQEVIEFSDKLLAEINEADVILLGLPFYNFGVPSQLKSYFDHLARAGVTFSYTENGPVGLIEGKKVVAFATRGGMYKGQSADFQVPFVKQFLGFIGMTDVDVIYAEGLAMGDQAEKSLADAHQSIAELSK